MISVARAGALVALATVWACAGDAGPDGGEAVAGQGSAGTSSALPASRTPAGLAAVEAHPDAYARVVAVEDARGRLSTDELLAIARGEADGRETADTSRALVRSWAVRALGRLGDPALVPDVLPFLADPDPAVRIEAAHALAALRGERGPGSGAVLPALRRAALDPAEEPRVRAGVAHALVRSARGAEELATVDPVLVSLAREFAPGPLGGAAGAEPVAGAAPATGAETPDVLLPLARAWELRARGRGEGWSDDEAVPALTSLYDATGEADSPAAGRTRRLVVAALRTRGSLPAPLLLRALAHPDAGVRHQAVLALGPDAPLVDAADRLRARLGDPDPAVRLEALRRWDRWLRGEEGCGPVLAAVDDPHPHVALAALELLAGPCADEGAQRRALLQVVEGGAGGGGAVPSGGGAGPAGGPRAGLREALRNALALQALAEVAPPEARSRLPEAAADPDPFVRARAAGAAARLEDADLLRTLAADPDPNVRTAALEGLGGTVGHEADSVYRAELGSDDAQLVLTATGLLEGTPEAARAAAAMSASLLRFTATRSETVRDVRLALLDGLSELGVADPEALRPLLRDYDPVVAARAAELLAATTGEPARADPRPLPPVDPPDADELAALARTTVVLEMARGGEIAIRLRPDRAATNAARFARLAREGWFDGLTFHRVVPNFIIQGGSPGANEYAGAPRYSRDELGRAGHWAGTVGLSTRGRDTGDAQLFINLVDNPRLDFEYTVFGEVVRGLDVAGAVVEGDVIRRARVEVGTGPAE